MNRDLKQVLKVMLKKQGKALKDLYSLMGLTRQGLDYKLAKSDLSLTEMDTIAGMLGLEQKEIIDIIQGKSKPSEQSMDTAHFQDNSYLKRYIEGLEEEIKHLREANMLLLGKSDGVSHDQHTNRPSQLAGHPPVYRRSYRRTIQ